MHPGGLQDGFQMEICSNNNAKRHWRILVRCWKAVNTSVSLKCITCLSVLNSFKLEICQLCFEVALLRSCACDHHCTVCPKWKEKLCSLNSICASHSCLLYCCKLEITRLYCSSNSSSTSNFDKALLLLHSGLECVLPELYVVQESHGGFVIGHM